VICRTSLVLPVQALAPVPVPKNSIWQPVFTKAGLPQEAAMQLDGPGLAPLSGGGPRPKVFRSRRAWQRRPNQLLLNPLRFAPESTVEGDCTVVSTTPLGPLGPPFPAGILEIAGNSFFFVSTEITGWFSAKASRTASLMNWKWASHKISSRPPELRR
jgi:hypothetical protein